MKILVCGGRDFANLDNKDHDSLEFKEKYKEYEFVFDELEKIAKEYVPGYPSENCMLPEGIEIISGKARGVDKAAVDWAIVNWVPFREFPADWLKYGKSAGPIRNKQMLKEGKPNLVVAFPGGRGTKDMINQARKAGVEVKEIRYR